jgi:hypothetical protein
MVDAQKRRTVPLSVALDYVGTILEDSRKDISRLKSEVEEYNLLCNTMESEIDSLLRALTLCLPFPARPLDSRRDSTSTNGNGKHICTDARGFLEIHEPVGRQFQDYCPVLCKGGAKLS